jgi:cytochrome c peroxidase
MRNVYRIATCASLLIGTAFVAACDDAGQRAAILNSSRAADSPPTSAHPDVSALRPITTLIDLDNPKVHLGKLLFNDTRLSRDDSVSCATCHDVANGGDDGRPFSVGIDQQVGERNSPTVLNASLNFAQFWDGRAATLAEQIAGPVRNPLEMDSDWPEILTKLGRDRELVKNFAALYSDGLTSTNITDAIVAYETALLTPNSPFDRFLLGDQSALSGEARQGYALFLDFGCASCHQGQNIGGNMYQRFGIIGNYIDDRGNLTESDLGRFNVTNRPEDKYFFKVPSLRNVGKTAPYFHDGSAATLDTAVKIMATYQLGRPISEDQIAVIVSFLNSLTSDVDASLL